MSRQKLMAAAALLLAPLAACDEGTPPPPTGAIEGQVSIEGQGVDGVTVTLSDGKSATTAGGGSYRFAGVEGGTYTVTISGYPSDASFDATSASAVIATADQVVRLNFAGSYIRTASVLGAVTVEGAGQANVKVTLSGMSSATATTSADGAYAFTGLRAGTYTVEISEFDAGSYGFSNTSQSATVGVGASASVNFDGTHIRTARVLGTVTVEGEGLGGVLVSLSGVSEATATTDDAGSYAFTNLQAGTYAVAISGFDASQYGFDAATLNATVGVGETANLNFMGTALRTAGITGMVTVEGEGLGGVTVNLSGTSEATATTDNTGSYAFDSLAAGSYVLAISAFDADSYDFNVQAKSATVAAGGTASVDFTGSHIRTADISGKVMVEGEGLGGVVVSLSGASEATATTDDAGSYAFPDLRAGSYTVEIAFDASQYDFDVVTLNATVAVGGSATNLNFTGSHIRTAGISGTVAVDGQLLGGVVVSLSGVSEAKETTNAAGSYAFTGLQAGSYTVEISEFGAGLYEFSDTSKSATVAVGESETVNFTGSHIRTAGISGKVMVGDEGISGVVVSLSGVSEAEDTTDATGSYAFTDLQAGSYVLEISEFDETLYEFDVVATSAKVAVGESENVNFTGSHIRTASISGTVAVEGGGIGGVVVSLSGVSEAKATTDAAGSYAFTGLQAGSYTVEISEFDADLYEFSDTSKSATVAVGASENVNFTGSHIRTAGISGKVMVGEMGIEDVVVKLSGVSEAEDTTDATGSYAFTGLQAGSYTVEISEFDAGLYQFAATTLNATVAVGGTASVDFPGTALRAAGFSGRLFVDEIQKNNELDLGEALLEVAGVPVVLVGPTVIDSDTTRTNAQGMYTFDELTAGSYRLTVLHDHEDAADLPSWVGYGGAPDGYLMEVTSPGMQTVNFPFDITMQTVKMKAMYGAEEQNGDPAVGVRVNLHATSGAATAGGTGALGSKLTDEEGNVTFTFERTKDTGPGGGLVYARATAVNGTELISDGTMPVEYQPTTHEVTLAAPFRVLSTRAVLEFAVENLSNDGESGGDAMPGWTAYVWHDAMDADTLAPAIDTLPSGATDGMVKMTYDGMKPGDTRHIRLAGPPEVSAESQPNSVTKGESFKLTATKGKDGGLRTKALDKVSTTTETPFLTYTHDGLSVPATKMDVGTMAVTFTTQTLTVGVHHERDNIAGFTNVAPGDVRPTDDDLGAARADATLQLSMRDSRTGYPVPLDDGDGGETNMPKKPAYGTGLATWTKLDSDINLIVEAEFENNLKGVTPDRLNVFDLTTEGTETKGSFGSDGGLVPVVMFCPQTVTDGPAYSDDCSTFGYKFQSGEINLRAHSRTYPSGDSVVATGVKIKAVRIEGVGATSPTDETTNDDGEAGFENLVDGTYVVTLSPDTKGLWGFGTRSPDTVTILGGADAAEHNLGQSLADTLTAYAIHQKTMIQGTVVNDRDGGGAGNDVVDDGETEEGILLRLVRGTRTIVATTTTNADGEYDFEDVAEGTYQVHGPTGSNYVLCAATAKQNTCSTTTAAKSASITTTAEDTVAERHDVLPVWNYFAYGIDSERAESYDFVVVFTDGRMEGHVERVDNTETPPVTTDFEGVTVDAFLCETWSSGCTEFVRSGLPDESVQTDEDGEWSMTGLREGIYRITVDVPQGETATPAMIETTGGQILMGKNARTRSLDFSIAN